MQIRVWGAACGETVVNRSQADLWDMPMQEYSFLLQCQITANNKVTTNKQ